MLEHSRLTVDASPNAMDTESTPQIAKKKYVRAVGPRLRVLLCFIFGLFAALGANSVYLTAITFLEWWKGDPINPYPILTGRGVTKSSSELPPHPAGAD